MKIFPRPGIGLGQPPRPYITGGLGISVPIAIIPDSEISTGDIDLAELISIILREISVTSKESLPALVAVSYSNVESSSGDIDLPELLNKDEGGESSSDDIDLPGVSGQSWL